MNRLYLGLVCQIRRTGCNSCNGSAKKLTVCSIAHRSQPSECPLHLVWRKTGSASPRKCSVLCKTSPSFLKAFEVKHHPQAGLALHSIHLRHNFPSLWLRGLSFCYPLGRWSPLHCCSPPSSGFTWTFPMDMCRPIGLWHSLHCTLKE